MNEQKTGTKIYFFDGRETYMGDEFINSNEIFDGQEYIPEKMDKESYEPDPYIAQDLVILFKMKIISDETHIFIGEQKKKIDKLKNKLYYSYNDFDQKTNDTNDKERSKNIGENIQWKEEVQVVREEEKINILKYIVQRGLIIDRLKFLGEQDLTVTFLGVAIGSVDLGNEKDEDPCVSIQPEFVLNAAGGVEPPTDDDMLWEVDVDQIKEIVVDNTKYTFFP